jgi:hypothetical protein
MCQCDQRKRDLGEAVAAVGGGGLVCGEGVATGEWGEVCGAECSSVWEFSTSSRGSPAANVSDGVTAACDERRKTQQSHSTAPASKP